MAATTAAVVGSSFSTTTMQSLKYLSPKYYSSFDPLPLLRMSSNRTMLFQALAVGHIPKKCRIPRISAAVAQGEVAATAPVEVEEEVVSVEGKADEADAASSKKDEVDAVSTKLYFGNLPYLCDSAQLAGIIQDYASPELIEVLYDRDTGKSRGFAFVTMSSVEDCNSVIKNLDGCEYGGRTLRVNFADKPKPKEPLYPETEFKLFVGNLSWTVTSESLTQAFQEYGSVVGARVLYDGETGKSRGYGFVSYATKQEMDTALTSLDGMELEGRTLRVSLAQGKRQ